MNAPTPFLLPPPPAELTARCHRFLAANRQSRIVYASVDLNGTTFRLADDRTFTLSRAERQAVGHGRWADL